MQIKQSAINIYVLYLYIKKLNNTLPIYDSVFRILKFIMDQNKRFMIQKSKCFKMLHAHL